MKTEEEIVEGGNLGKQHIQISLHPKISINKDLLEMLQSVFTKISKQHKISPQDIWLRETDLKIARFKKIAIMMKDQLLIGHHC